MPEGDAELADLYRDVLLDYYRSPAHKGKVEDPDLAARGFSPTCGDEIEVTARREGGRLARLRFAGHGCVISQASSAMMAEALEGKALDEVRALIKSFGDVMVRQAALDSLPEALEETKALEGVRRFPARVKCAMLSWNTLEQGLSVGPGAESAQYMETGG